MFADAFNNSATGPYGSSLRYKSHCETRLGNISKCFETYSGDAKGTFEDITYYTRDCARRAFGIINSRRLSVHRGQLVRRLSREFEDAVALITGYRGEAARQCLLACLDDSLCRPYKGIDHNLYVPDLFQSLITAVLMVRVFTQELLPKIGVPSSQTCPGLTFLYQGLSDKDPDEALVLRYQWRDLRRSYLGKPSAKAEKVKLRDEILKELKPLLIFFDEDGSPKRFGEVEWKILTKVIDD